MSSTRTAEKLDINHLISEKYTVVIGLEIHAQLLTASKIYTGDSNQFGDAPNTNISEITIGHPGTLPKLNRKVVEYAIKMGLACDSEISRINIFDRKNYFYPDLPKGYQITQDKTPICLGGYIPVKLKNGVEKKIKLTKIHVEEDAGKSIHVEGEKDTLVDLNRAGVPLIEIVTEPDIRSSEEAHVVLTETRRLVKYLDICDGNMEEGSMRCDANISIMLKSASEYGKKVEVKNMNSIRNVQRAIDHEVERQITILEHGGIISSETRTFDANAGTTAGMRTKEELNDYRYFPDPDLSPMHVSEEWLDAIRAAMPSLPNELKARFMSQYELPEYDASVLIDAKETALYFDELCDKTKNYKSASNWVMGPVKSYLNDQNKTLSEFPISTDQMAELIELVDDQKVSFSTASKQLFKELINRPNISPINLAEELNLIQDSDVSSIEPIIEEVLASMPDKVKAYKKGKKGLIGLFMSEVMKKSRGKADPKVANELIRSKLS
ncbi:MAG: Asp-tRNA(Asn)/Glu-tRNA(Gln) amidotransferase subunit GatB [Bacteroidota bacterium]